MRREGGLYYLLCYGAPFILFIALTHALAQWGWHEQVPTQPFANWEDYGAGFGFLLSCGLMAALAWSIFLSPSRDPVLGKNIALSYGILGCLFTFLLALVAYNMEAERIDRFARSASVEASLSQRFNIASFIRDDQGVTYAANINVTPGCELKNLRIVGDSNGVPNLVLKRGDVVRTLTKSDEVVVPSVCGP